ncbi:MAG TPA: pyridoxamine 5'-phosphate oxidase family protein [Alphaproteobacteria bacterium]|nr:pyridoxamine 5'-phosphate oxidase family protein [Alphaproteobacteria bacterium]
MADLEKAQKDPETQLWEVMDDVHAGMLGVEGTGQHLQPMAPNGDRVTKSIWFYARKDSDLVRSLDSPKPAYFCVIGDKHDYHASLAGQLEVNNDRGKIDEYWNSVVAAWFDGGKDDPSLVMLQMKLSDAAIWASRNNPITFGWEITKANVGTGDPDLGVRNHVRFAA